MDSHSKADRLLAAVIAVTAWITLGARVYVTVSYVMGSGRSLTDGLVALFSFFTIETNTILALVATACAIRGGHDRLLTRPSVLAAVTTYIVVVGLIYALLLDGLRHLTGLAIIVDFGLHRVLPVLFALYWLAFAPKGRLGWRDPIVWLVFPLLYIGYFLIYGALTGRYLYPFGNVPLLGYPRALANGGLILAAFYATGLFVVTLDRILARFGGLGS